MRHIKECPPCPVCGGGHASLTTHLSGFLLDCHRCGQAVLTEECIEDLEGEVERVPYGRAILSHALRKMGGKNPALLTTNRLRDVLENMSLPTPQAQLENLIEVLAEKAPMLGSEAEPDAAWLALVGAIDDGALAFLIKETVRAGLVASSFSGEGEEGVIELFGGIRFVPLRLTMQGWALYQELLRGRSDSRIAFMAMKFAEDDLNRIIASHVAPAVQATGFDLLNLQDSEKAGLIDDRIRVEIRRAKFLLADLTHHSNGAYWEAGFAEGLGKPVIYLCRRDVFNDKDNTTHFDTNHHLTIEWAEETIAEDMKRLKATIRATLPGEARLED